jgi:hypothetical protein
LKQRIAPHGKETLEWTLGRERLSLAIQGKLLQVKHHFPHQQPAAAARRSQITAFTYAARLRLLKLIATIDWHAVQTSLFVTLTYPDEVAEPDLKTRNKHRYLFHRSLEAYLQKEIAVLWKIEWKPRLSGSLKGTHCPHWHLLLFSCRYISYAKINLVWRQTIGHEGYVRTEIKRALGEEAAGMYIAKYLSKQTCDASLVYAAYHNCGGRHWGILRKDRIPRAVRHVITDLTPAEEAFLLGFADENLYGNYAMGRQSFTLIGQLAVDAGGYFLKKRLTDGSQGC